MPWSCLGEVAAALAAAGPLDTLQPPSRPGRRRGPQKFTPAESIAIARLLFARSL